MSTTSATEIQLEPLSIAQAYGKAIAIVVNARASITEVRCIWDKLYRTAEYLQQQAKAELAETLGGAE